MPHRVVWTVAFEDGPRRVELAHRRLLGRVAIRVDGVRVENAPRTISKLCKNPFITIAGRRCAFLVNWNLLGWTYELVMDGRSMDTGLTAEVSALRRRPDISLIQAGTVAVALASIAMTLYAGVNFVLPFAAALAVYGVLLASTTGKDTRLRPYFPAFAVQGGHFVWILFGLVTIIGSEQYRWYWELVPAKYSYFLEPSLLLAGLVFLLVRPGVLAVVFLVAVHFHGLVTGAQSMVDPSEIVQQKGIVVHSAFRIAAIALLAFAARTRK